MDVQLSQLHELCGSIKDHIFWVFSRKDLIDAVSDCHSIEDKIAAI